MLLKQIPKNIARTQTEWVTRGCFVDESASFTPQQICGYHIWLFNINLGLISKWILEIVFNNINSPLSLLFLHFIYFKRCWKLYLWIFFQSKYTQWECLHMAQCQWLCSVSKKTGTNFFSKKGVWQVEFWGVQVLVWLYITSIPK